MAIDISAYTGQFANMAKSGLSWTVGAIIVGLTLLLFYARMRKKADMKYNCLELVKFGNGKIGVNKMVAGPVGKKQMFFGLFSSGEKVMKVADGRTIIDATTADLHDIFGKRGFICRRKDDDPKILVPITTAEFSNEAAMFAIAPSDFRDVSVGIVNEATKETQGIWEKILPYIAVGIIVVLTIISIIINQQMTNNTIDKVGKMLIEGCTNSLSTKPGVAP